MKSLFALALLIAPAFFAPFEDEGEPWMVADVKDYTGTVTRVSGLNYCYEEPEGDKVYINKHDNFFVQRGEAVIKVNFTNIASVTFQKGVIEDSERCVRKAVIRTRSGKQYDTTIICHPNCFLQGDVELGEFRLDFERVETMIFPGESNSKPAGFEARLSIDEKTSEGMLSVMLLADGAIRIEGNMSISSRDHLAGRIKEMGYTVFVKADRDLRYPVLMGQLKRLEDAGARTVVFR